MGDSVLSLSHWIPGSLCYSRLALPDNLPQTSVFIGTFAAYLSPVSEAKMNLCFAKCGFLLSLVPFLYL